MSFQKTTLLPALRREAAPDGGPPGVPPEAAVSEAAPPPAAPTPAPRADRRDTPPPWPARHTR